jgi:hypothetical protein
VNERVTEALVTGCHGPPSNDSNADAGDNAVDGDTSTATGTLRDDVNSGSAGTVYEHCGGVVSSTNRAVAFTASFPATSRAPTVTTYSPSPTGQMRDEQPEREATASSTCTPFSQPTTVTLFVSLTHTTSGDESFVYPDGAR